VAEDDDKGIPDDSDYSNPPDGGLIERIKRAGGHVEGPKASDEETKPAEMKSYGDQPDRQDTGGHVEGPPPGSESANTRVGKMRDYSNPPGADQGGLQTPSDYDTAGLQRMFGPDALQAYITRKHAAPPDAIKQIDEGNGGQKDPNTLYRSLGSLTDPSAQYAYLMGKAKIADTGATIAQSLSAGEHGPPNFRGAANSLNEAAAATPDGNHIHVTSAGDNTVINVSPVDQVHNVKTFVVPNDRLATIAPMFRFDNAMSGKLIPALEQAHQDYVNPAQVPVMQRGQPTGPAPEEEQSLASYNPSTYQQMLDKGGKGLVKAGGPEDNAAHEAMNQGYANREADIRNKLAAHPGDEKVSGADYPLVHLGTSHSEGTKRDAKTGKITEQHSTDTVTPHADGTFQNPGSGRGAAGHDRAAISTAQQEAVNTRHEADRSARSQEAMRKLYADERTRDLVEMDDEGRFKMAPPNPGSKDQPGLLSRIFGGSSKTQQEQEQQPLPPKNQLVTGQTYQTTRGPAIWDGQKFTPVRQ